MVKMKYTRIESVSDMEREEIFEGTYEEVSALVSEIYFEDESQSSIDFVSKINVENTKGEI